MTVAIVYFTTCTLGVLVARWLILGVLWIAVGGTRDPRNKFPWRIPGWVWLVGALGAAFLAMSTDHKLHTNNYLGYPVDYVTSYQRAYDILFPASAVIALILLGTMIHRYIRRRSRV